MTRGEFEKLTERYREGKCTREEMAFVEKWVELNCRQVFDGRVFRNESEATDIEAEMWGEISVQAGLRRKLLVPNYSAWLTAAAAVAVCLLLGVLVFVLADHDAQPVPVMAGLETHNTSHTSLRIVLPDSSVVMLGQAASIITSESYGKSNRAVRLNGEAFFEVRPNPKSPFLVYSGDLVTEVLGTSFAIKPEAGGKTIEVSVEKGKVSVYTNAKDRNERRSGVIITSNQKVVYHTEMKTIRQDIVDAPKMVKKDVPASVFRFDETRVGTVLSVLQQAYGMEIIVNNPALNDCEFTGNLNGFDLFRQLNYICNAIDATYEVRGAAIFLKGNGCGPGEK